MQTPQPRTVESISLMREQEDLPFVRADCDGLVIETNQRFRENDKRGCNTRKKYDQNAQKNISNLHLEILIT